MGGRAGVRWVGGGWCGEVVVGGRDVGSKKNVLYVVPNTVLSDCFVSVFMAVVVVSHR